MISFPLTPEPEDAAREAGRLLFAGPVDFVKGVVAMPGLPPPDRLEVCFAGRSTLRRAFVLIDTRHGVKKVDEEIMTLLDRSAVTFQTVLTKADKVSRTEREAILDQVRDALRRHPAAYPELVVTSSEKGDGIETLRSIIATLD